MARAGIPAISVETMIQVGRLMTESYGIQLMQMMELASSNLGRLAIRLFLREPQTKIRGSNPCRLRRERGRSLPRASTFHRTGFRVPSFCSRTASRAPKTSPLTAEQRDRLVEIADKCPVHRTLTSRPLVETRLG